MNSTIAEEIRVFGTVQGVGFRPTVYRLAKACGLRGEVRNAGSGVFIRIVGDGDNLETFLHRLQTEAPPLARIERIQRQGYDGDRNYADFTITASSASPVRTEIPPDAATCPACQAETFDPLSRWYGYPFTNCTHCGPRLSLIQSLPYDRDRTSMAKFSLCPDCEKDYADPENRRFHAQPTACPRCGPQVWLEGADGQKLGNGEGAIARVGEFLQQGKIVAIKGLGGFHLACDGTNEELVQKLRHRKRRPHKAFALMARDLAIIAEYCSITERDRKLLQSPAAPIVLMVAKGKQQVAPAVAPGQNRLGFMLPYMPLHHLIWQHCDRPMVLTSGNLSDEPQCIENRITREKLANIADYFLFHDRDIVNRVDDSVVRVVGDRSQILRRARGYAPAPISLPAGFARDFPILAMGSELKNTFCLLREGQAIVSQHIGDLANVSASAAYEQSLDLYLHLLEHQPKAIAIDKHPEYLSHKLGKTLAEANHLPLISIQHHHAHIAACLVENGLAIDAPPVLGIALDGLGYGEDGTLWGGEFLLADYRGFTRLGMFKPVPMLGGEQAIYQPWRNTYAHLWDIPPNPPSKVSKTHTWGKSCTPSKGIPPNPPSKGGDRREELFAFLATKPLDLFDRMMREKINSPLASSCGRLFDAVAAAIGVCRESCSYEGQGAMMLEAIAAPQMLSHPEETGGYPFALETLRTEEGEILTVLEPRPMWRALLIDLQTGMSRSQIAAKFHRGLIDAIVAMTLHLCKKLEQQKPKIVLTGGVFQNQILHQGVKQKLESREFTLLTHSQVPPNDGGISLGQAAIAFSMNQQPTTNNQQQITNN